MAKVKAFKALRYNQEKIKNLGKVVCPPYDVISAQKQDYYHKLDPHNLIHVLLRKDIPGEDKYKVAAEVYRQWLKDGVITQDNSPTIYFYSQQYKIQGETKTRFGFISLLGLDSKTFGHEHTRQAAKEDRFKLMSEVKANLSPIFIVFEDKKRIIQRMLKYLQGKPPVIDVTDDEATVHKLWCIDDPEMVGLVESSMAAENTFIADGHHRYEVACAYHQNHKSESSGYVLSYFTNTDFKGLTIMAIHRLLKSPVKIETAGLLKKLSEYFDVEEIKDKTKFFFLMQKGGRTEHMLGMYKDKKYWLLRLKNVSILDKIMPDKPKEYRSLDVAILNAIVLSKILGVDVENKENLVFHPDADEFIAEVDTHPDYIAFFLNPVKIQQIIDVALGGNKMPAKSTYFYPKVLSGLVINKIG